MIKIIQCIANPQASRGKTAKRFDSISKFFHQHHIHLEPIWTERAGHAKEIAFQLVDRGVDTLIALGGDGTMHEVINGVLHNPKHSQVRLGILPLGTGNAFLRDFGIIDWKQAAECIVQEKTKRVDIGQAVCVDSSQTRVIFFSNLLGFGLIAEACRLRNDRYRFLGRYAYHAAFFHLLPFLNRCNIDVRIIAEDIRKETCVRTPIFMISNSQYTGYGMHISPESNTQDGLLNLLYASQISVLEVLQLFQSLSTGKHLLHPKVTNTTFKSLELKQEGSSKVMIDGEIIFTRSMRIEVLHQVLEIFA